MKPEAPSSLSITYLEALTLQELTDWFYLRFHARDPLPRANARIEEQEGDLLLDAYQFPDLSKEARRRFRLAAVNNLQNAVENSPSDWEDAATEDLCCIIPAFVYGEEEEDPVARLLLQAADCWPWVSESRLRLKRLALLTLGDLSWQLVRVPCPNRAYWEKIWEQEATEDFNGRRRDYVGEAAGAIFSGIERSDGIAAALDWLGSTRWRGDYNADLIRKLIPSRKQKMGTDHLMKLIYDHLIPAMKGDDTKEDVVIEAMTGAGIAVTPEFFERADQVKSAKDRTIDEIIKRQIWKLLPTSVREQYGTEKSMLESLTASLLIDSLSSSLRPGKRLLDMVSNALRSGSSDGGATVSACVAAVATSRMANEESLSKDAADYYERTFGGGKSLIVSP